MGQGDSMDQHLQSSLSATDTVKLVQLMWNQYLDVSSEISWLCFAFLLQVNSYSLYFISSLHCAQSVNIKNPKLQHFGPAWLPAEKAEGMSCVTGTKTGNMRKKYPFS